MLERCNVVCDFVYIEITRITLKVLEWGGDGWTLAFLAAPPVALLLDYQHKETKERIVRQMKIILFKILSHFCAVYFAKIKIVMILCEPKQDFLIHFEAIWIVRI